MILNNEQRKHIAGSLRVVAMAQFAAFGYAVYKTGDWLIAVISAIIYLSMEFLAVIILHGKENGT